MARLYDLQPRTSFITFSLSALLMAACSDSEGRPPLAPTLEDGNEDYVAPNTPAYNPDLSGTGGTPGTQDDGGGGFAGTGGTGGSGTGGTIDLGVGGDTTGGAGGLGGTGGVGGDDTFGAGGTGGVGGNGGSPLTWSSS